LRKGLGLYANLRPVTVQPVLRGSSPVRESLLEGVDMMIVRELTGGLYFGKPSEQREGPNGREVVDTLFYTEGEIRRVVKLAFELARGRRKKLTSVDKANVLSSSRLWRTIVEEVKAEYPDVTVEHRLVDACAMTQNQRPAVFDVIVTENLFGDILSDEASVLAGSLGMLPSASICERRTAYGLHGLYEPIHGSAPDIAGKDVANPLATILSGAMMLRWSLGQPAAAEAIERAVADALVAGYRTPDLVAATGDQPGQKRVGTQAMADAVVAALEVGASQKVGAASAGAGTKAAVR
jgi:3-isopropylmalate dehydrogenase